MQKKTKFSVCVINFPQNENTRSRLFVLAQRCFTVAAKWLRVLFIPKHLTLRHNIQVNNSLPIWRALLRLLCNFVVPSFIAVHLPMNSAVIIIHSFSFTWRTTFKEQSSFVKRGVNVDRKVVRTNVAATNDIYVLYYVLRVFFLDNNYKISKHTLWIYELY